MKSVLRKNGIDLASESQLQALYRRIVDLGLDPLIVRAFLLERYGSEAAPDLSGSDVSELLGSNGNPGALEILVGRIAGVNPNPPRVPLAPSREIYPESEPLKPRNTRSRVIKPLGSSPYRQRIYGQSLQSIPLGWGTQ